MVEVSKYGYGCRGCPATGEWPGIPDRTEVWVDMYGDLVDWRSVAREPLPFHPECAQVYIANQKKLWPIRPEREEVRVTYYPEYTPVAARVKVKVVKQDAFHIGNLPMPGGESEGQVDQPLAAQGQHQEQGDPGVQQAEAPQVQVPSADQVPPKKGQLRLF